MTGLEMMAGGERIYRRSPVKSIWLPWRSRITYAVKEVKEVAPRFQKALKNINSREPDPNGSGEIKNYDLSELKEKLKSLERMEIFSLQLTK